jgi:hypothetical protein
LFQEILCKTVEFRKVLHVSLSLDTSCNTVPKAYPKTHYKMCRYMKNCIHEVGTTSLECFWCFCHITTNQNVYMPCLYKQKSRECNWLNGSHTNIQVIFSKKIYTSIIFLFCISPIFKANKKSWYAQILTK